jgi:hypothetical protein
VVMRAAWIVSGGWMRRSGRLGPRGRRAAARGRSEVAAQSLQDRLAAKETARRVEHEKWQQRLKEQAKAA